MPRWIDVCAGSDIGEEDVFRFDQGAEPFIIVYDHEGDYFRTDCLCTHEDVQLADGFVLQRTVERTKHASIFEVTTGTVKTPPACKNLLTYRTKVKNGLALIEV